VFHCHSEHVEAAVRDAHEVNAIQLQGAHELIEVLDLPHQTEILVIFRSVGHPIGELVNRQHAEFLGQAADVPRPQVSATGTDTRQHHGVTLSVVVIARVHTVDVDELCGEPIDLPVWSDLGVYVAADDEAKEHKRDVRSNAARRGCHGVVLSRSPARASVARW
jgi:hypothetical protein